MLLEINTEHTDFIKHILPYTKNGILIDTSVMKMFIDGFIQLKFSKQKNQEYCDLISLFELLKVGNKWDKFWITPHLFTEICHHFCRDKCSGICRNKRKDFKDIVKEIIPILKDINEEEGIKKNLILNLIDKDKPVIEMGDLSIFVAVDNILETKDKISVIAKDKGIKEKYENYPNVLMIDYYKTILDLKQ